MQKQLKLTKTQLEKIGFKKKVYPADGFDNERTAYEIDCLYGCFYYTDDVVHRWYQRIKPGSGYVSTHLDIQQAKELFNVLKAFRVDYNFYNI